ncbi:hypothetical protein BU24DRAFT_406386 [Aaosphaeria arxii CBS 175.79]|uniref:Zn(2)-C6 fungal-type domain-containing protein n=1 Tax=Aaosphaeria arxii CBS 175.79 TaxID=1450172 RepID=A0A6A5Y3A5_9PLEO|nr:uncharacterized protein BU24DRAFT_406386 [Aaosphaeria arxii CBS 175.79]KAF2019759.1 hypothetical protein BU24DRAFT_406386 [Aaosphaeria arxii CBS 175.79]
MEDTLPPPEQQQPAPKRTRRKNAKSRQGCARCKTKRIKCDEKRPGCGNCGKSGNVCPGYEQRLKWSRKYEKLSTTADGNGTLLQWNSGRDGERDRNAEGSSRPREDLTVDGDPVWPVVSSSAWQDVQLNLDSGLVEGDYDSIVALENFDMSNTQHDHFSIPDLGIPQTPNHLPTTLIEYWFRFICPMRSTFDSDINYNRTMAWTSWNASGAVFYTMQTMSAACLLKTMPQLSETLPLLRTQALAAINQGMSQVRSSPIPNITADLLFAIFSLGTSQHWITPGMSETPFLESARELLSTWKATPSVAGGLVYNYFSRALTYWEMLLTMTGRGSIPAKIKKKQQRNRSKLLRALNLPGRSDDNIPTEPQPQKSDPEVFGTRPNSWCGLSSEVIEVFSQVMALCRSTCLHRQKDRNSRRIDTVSDTLCDISLGHELQRELLAMDFGTLVLVEEIQGHPVITQDDKTPVAHLLHTAEAYRQAALLQLHLTFHDLPKTVATYAPADDHNGDEKAHAEFVLALTLRLVMMLQQIPPESGSRSIHPMLYLSAAAGLRYSAVSEVDDINVPDIFDPDVTLSNDLSLHDPILQMGDFLQEPNLDFDITELSSVNNPVTPNLRSTMGVLEARNFVWTRLNDIQQTLPHKSSGNILQLVNAIWRKYDDQTTGPGGTHWFECFAELGLEVMPW